MSSPYLDRPLRTEAEATAAERDRLREVNAELIAIVDESLAFVAAWAGTYQASHGREEIHPKHQETIDKIQAVLAAARGEGS